MQSRKVFNNILSGIILGLLGIVLALIPWTFKTGIFFDSSSILFCISGLFFGPVSTLIAMFIVVIYRIILSESEVYTQIALIISSGLIGIFWARFRPFWQNKKSYFEFAGMCISVNLIMYIFTNIMQNTAELDSLQNIVFPTLFIYPFALILFGEYMIEQNKRHNNLESINLSAEQWQFALEIAGEAVWDWNPKTNEVYYSRQWKLMLGYRDDEYNNMHKNWEELLHPDDYDAVNAQLTTYLKGETSNYEQEYRIKCKDGSYKWILCRGKVVSRDKNKKPLRFIGTYKDISHSKQKELLFAHEHYLLESLFKYTTECISFKDLESKFVRVNDAVARNFGNIDSSQLIGKSDFDFYIEEFARITYQQEQEIIRTGESLTLEEKGTFKNGKETWGINTKRPLRDINQNIIGTFGVAFDITELKIKEKMLLHEQFLLKALMDNTPDKIYYKDQDCRYTRINNSMARFLHLNETSDAIGKQDFDFFTLEYAQKAFDDEIEIMRTGQPVTAEEKETLQNGDVSWALTTKMPLRDFDGEIIGTFGKSADITEMKEKELLLEHERYLIDSLLKYSPESIFFKDIDSKFIRVNDTVARNIGAKNSEELIGKSDFDYFSNEYAAITYEQEQEIIRTGKPLFIEEKGIRKDGSVQWGLTNKMPLRDVDGSIIGTFGISIDISRLKEVEDALKSSQEELKNFAAHLQVVREEERVLLAREIHDELGQMLIALKIDLGMLKYKIIKNTKISEKENVVLEFGRIFNLLDKTLNTTRSIISGLRSEVLELVGITEAARVYTQEFSDRYHIKCQLHIGRSDIKVDRERSIALFRILQESMNNIAKHAKATEVRVNFDVVGSNIIMKIADNGIGIDENLKVKVDHYGLIGMKERVFLLDGKISISGKPNLGTTVIVEIPNISK